MPVGRRGTRRPPVKQGKGQVSSAEYRRDIFGYLLRMSKGITRKECLEDKNTSTLAASPHPERGVRVQAGRVSKMMNGLGFSVLPKGRGIQSEDRLWMLLKSGTR
jgi:hypothetical protein